jgi:hypothetical protein
MARRTSQAVTKQDLVEMREATKLDLANMREATKLDLADMREATKKDLADVRQDLATKKDLADVRQDLTAAREATKQEFVDMREATRQEFVAVRSDMAQMGADVRHTQQAVAELDTRLTGEVRSVKAAVENVAVHLNKTNTRLDTIAADVHEIGVKHELLDSMVRAGVDGWTSRIEGVRRDMSEMDERLGHRILALEDAVRGHSGHLQSLVGAVADLRARFDRRDFDSLERRVAVVEKKLSG